MRLVNTAVALLLLAGCGANGTAEAPASQPSTETVLTPEGWGPIRMGMSHDAVVAALGGKVQANPAPRDAEWRNCHVIPTNEPPHFAIMVEDDKVTRVETWGQIHASDKGVRVGDAEAKVRAAYPAGLSETPHVYRDPPAKYLTWYARPGQAGIRYEIGDKGVVTSILSGAKSIEYSEGCA